MGGTLVIGRLDTAFYDAYGEGVVSMPGKGMLDEGGVEELQAIEIGSALEPDNIAATLQFHSTYPAALPASVPGKRRPRLEDSCR